MQYFGLDLPEFKHGDIEVLFGESEFRAAAASGQRRFFRAARVLGPHSLKRTLEDATLHFDIIAGICDAEVIDYEFGLCELPGRTLSDEDLVKYRFTEGNQEMLPKGQFLVADVEAVKHAEDLNDLERGALSIMIYEGYFLPLVLSHSLRLFDARASQIVKGHTARSPDGFKFVDVDPYFKV